MKTTPQPDTGNATAEPATESGSEKDTIAKLRFELARTQAALEAEKHDHERCAESDAKNFAEMSARGIRIQELQAAQAEAKLLAAESDRSLEYLRAQLATMTANAERERLDKEQAEAKVADLDAELGHIHGKIGLFAEKWWGISNNLPTDETFRLMEAQLTALRSAADSDKERLAQMTKDRDRWQAVATGSVMAVMDMQDTARASERAAGGKET